MTVLTLNRTWKEQNALRITAMLLCCVLCLSFFMIQTTEVAFCTDPTTAPTTADSTSTENATTTAGNALETAVDTITNWIYSLMRRIITPIAACFFAFAGFQFLLGGRQGTEKARVTMFAGVCGILLVVFAPLIAQGIAGSMVGAGNGDLSNYNPLKG